MAQIDLLSFISDILGKRNQTSELAAERAFRGSESEKGRAANLNEFNISQQLARDKFLQDTQQQALDFGLNQQQVADRIRQFDLNLANEQAQQRQAQENFGRQQTNQENQQGISNLGVLSNLVGQGTTNMGQADILSLLAGRLGQPMSPFQFMNQGVAKPASKVPLGMWGPNGTSNYITDPSQMKTAYSYTDNYPRRF